MATEANSSCSSLLAALDSALPVLTGRASNGGRCTSTSDYAGTRSNPFVDEWAPPQDLLAPASFVAKELEKHTAHLQRVRESVTAEMEAMQDALVELTAYLGRVGRHTLALCPSSFKKCFVASTAHARERYLVCTGDSESRSGHGVDAPAAVACCASKSVGPVGRCAFAGAERGAADSQPTHKLAACLMLRSARPVHTLSALSL